MKNCICDKVNQNKSPKKKLLTAPEVSNIMRIKQKQKNLHLQKAKEKKVKLTTMIFSHCK